MSVIQNTMIAVGLSKPQTVHEVIAEFAGAAKSKLEAAMAYAATQQEKAEQARQNEQRRHEEVILALTTSVSVYSAEKTDGSLFLENLNAILSRRLVSEPVAPTD